MYSQRFAVRPIRRYRYGRPHLQRGPLYTMAKELFNPIDTGKYGIGRGC